MPDLNDDLFSSFKDEGAPMHALPASEVRRRGDRMRRRNNTLATVGGVAAALVAIATPLAIVTNQGGPTDSDSPIAGQPTEIAWKQEIPDSVDVSTGLPQGAETSGTAQVDSITICDATAFDAADGTVAVAGASWAPPEGGGLTRDRTLAVYRDGASARAALDKLTSAVSDCPTTRGAADGDRVEQALTTGQLNGDASVVVTQGFYGEGDDYPSLGTDYYVLALTGNALLVTHSASVPDDPSVEELDAEQQLVTDLVGQMQVFSEANAMQVVTDGETDLAGTIPDDFPLLAGWPDADLPEPFGLKGPARDLDLSNLETELSACGTSLDGSLREPVDSLYGGLRAPEGPQLRQLSTFASEEDAQAFAIGVTAFFTACGEEPVGDGVTRVYQLVESDGVGDDAATIVARNEIDGEPGSGFSLFQVVRVGSSVLLFTTTQDGDIGVEPVDQARAQELAASYLATNGPVIDAM